MDRARTPAERYRRRPAATAAGTSPLQAAIARAVSASDDALRVIEATPLRSRPPAVVLAALHDLALAGRAPALAAAFAAGDAGAAAAAAVEELVRATGQVVATAGQRRVHTVEARRCAVLHPAVAEAARRVGAGAVGLVAVGCPTGFDVQLDRVGIRYGDGRHLGDPRSPVQVSTELVGDRPVPARAVPPVVARIAVDPDPLDLTDPDDARWLRACVAPDRPERAAALDAELALAAAAPPESLRGDPVELLPDAVARVPADALPVVTTAWAMPSLPREGRHRFLQRLDYAAAGRTLAWVSVEGVGAAPGVPTLGDRPASGHSIVGLVLAGRSRPLAEALGRCWSRGRWLSWFAGPTRDPEPSGAA